MARYRFTSRIKDWTAKTEAKLDLAVLEMATDIDNISSRLAPVETGALAKSGRVKRNGLANYSVIYGGGSIPYARRRHYENKKTPGSLRYLERGGDAVSRNVKSYIRGL